MINLLKVQLKKIIPSPLLEFRHSHRKRQIQRDIERSNTELSHCADAKQVFTLIYRKNYWGKPIKSGDKYYSGSGSHSNEIVDGYVVAVNNCIGSLGGSPIVVDLGCGDFAVGARISLNCSKYLAVDIVDGLIDRNKKLYANFTNVEFISTDIIEEPIPSGDVVLLREVLQHLSNNDIYKIITKLSANYRFLILTENLPLRDSFEANLDKQRGSDIRLHIGEQGSGVILTEPPFCLAIKRNVILHEVFKEVLGRKAVVRTNLYEL